MILSRVCAAHNNNASESGINSRDDFQRTSEVKKLKLLSHTYFLRIFSCISCAHLITPSFIVVVTKFLAVSRSLHEYRPKIIKLTAD